MKVPPLSMALRFYNTLTQQVEDFTPASDNTVRMYTCGPTVYDFAHIGNFRTFTFVDLLRKWLRANGFQLEPRDEHHRRGRQDHPQRRGRSRSRSTSTPQIYTRGLSGRLRRAAPGAARTPGAAPPNTSTTWWRPSRSWASSQHTYYERRLGLLQDRQLPGVRQALAQRFQRQSGRRPRGCGRVREGRRARFRPVEDAQGRRAVLGHRASARAVPAGTSSAP